MKPKFSYELQKQFEQALIGGKYAQDDLVTGNDLAPQYGTTPEEMDKILRAAYRKGLVDKAEGDTFRILGFGGPGLDSVFMHTQRSGLKPRSVVRFVEVESASEAVAAKLKIEPGSPVYRFVRTRRVNQEELANQTNFIPYEVAPELDQDDVSNYSFQKLLEEKYRATTAEVEESYEIVPATDQDREILELPPGSSVLYVQRLAFGRTGQPIVWANIRIRPDRFEYVSQLWPEAAKILAEQDAD